MKSALALDKDSFDLFEAFEDDEEEGIDNGAEFGWETEDFDTELTEFEGDEEVRRQTQRRGPGSRGKSRLFSRQSQSRRRPRSRGRPLRFPRPRSRRRPRRAFRGPLRRRRLTFGFPPEETLQGTEFVRWVQASLNRVLALRLPVNGILGPETRSAVRRFQDRERLPVTGIVGPDTERALIAALAGVAPAEPAGIAPAEPAEPEPSDGELADLEFAEDSGEEVADFLQEENGAPRRPRRRTAPVTVARSDLGVSAKLAAAYDRAFQGKFGERFKTLVETAARAVDLNPGLVADTLLAETRRDRYFATDQVGSFEIGADDFYAKRADMKRKVPAYTKVRWDPQRIVTNVNEAGRAVKSVFFRSGADAVLASAVYLKHGEFVLREAAAAAGGDFDALPVATRFALVRLAFNAGHGRARKNLSEALAGRDVLVRKPPQKSGPQRHATIHAARAMRLSETVFGTPAK